jgi:hypothetical protein
VILRLDYSVKMVIEQQLQAAIATENQRLAPKDSAAYNLRRCPYSTQVVYQSPWLKRFSDSGSQLHFWRRVLQQQSWPWQMQVQLDERGWLCWQMDSMGLCRWLNGWLNPNAWLANGKAPDASQDLDVLQSESPPRGLLDATRNPIRPGQHRDLLVTEPILFTLQYGYARGCRWQRVLKEICPNFPDRAPDQLVDQASLPSATSHPHLWRLLLAQLDLTDALDQPSRYLQPAIAQLLEQLDHVIRHYPLGQFHKAENPRELQRVHGLICVTQQILAVLLQPLHQPLPRSL